MLEPRSARSPYDGIFNLQVRKLQYKHQYEFCEAQNQAGRDVIKESIQKELFNRNMLLM